MPPLYSRNWILPSVRSHWLHHNLMLHYRRLALFMRATIARLLDQPDFAGLSLAALARKHSEDFSAPSHVQKENYHEVDFVSPYMRKLKSSMRAAGLNSF